MILKATGKTRGAFATVVIDSANSRAYKIFKNNRHPDYSGEDSFNNERNKAVFRAEVEAYRRIESNPLPAQHTPEFYEVLAIEKVLDSEDNDISDGYLLDCCYCMRLCFGEDVKYRLGQFAHLDEFANQMRQIGIGYLIDSSVFNSDSSDSFMFIDFATHDAAYEYDCNNL